MNKTLFITLLMAGFSAYAICPQHAAYQAALTRAVQAQTLLEQQVDRLTELLPSVDVFTRREVMADRGYKMDELERARQESSAARKRLADCLLQ